MLPQGSIALTAANRACPEAARPAASTYWAKRSPT